MLVAKRSCNIAPTPILVRVTCHRDILTDRQKLGQSGSYPRGLVRHPIFGACGEKTVAARACPSKASGWSLGEGRLVEPVPLSRVKSVG